MRRTASARRQPHDGREPSTAPGGRRSRSSSMPRGSLSSSSTSTRSSARASSARLRTSAATRLRAASTWSKSTSMLSSVVAVRRSTSRGSSVCSSSSLVVRHVVWRPQLRGLGRRRPARDGGLPPLEARCWLFGPDGGRLLLAVERSTQRRDSGPGRAHRSVGPPMEPQGRPVRGRSPRCRPLGVRPRGLRPGGLHLHRAGF